ncbi:hypothetical protein [Rugamonas apoptosis]|uniref:Uncharacterized protein n=1 Tax=Rugamonas apoptosis TaxID=2758570 RepID=A0A7W2F5Z5_9BURK|nr:hypothetical protein [Rugamonas apoptosis]MBA5685731.1 hypothetical protein [Rugamonas apoptosis]
MNTSALPHGARFSARKAKKCQQVWRFFIFSIEITLLATQAKNLPRRLPGQRDAAQHEHAITGRPSDRHVADGEHRPRGQTAPRFPLAIGILARKKRSSSHPGGGMDRPCL